MFIAHVYLPKNRPSSTTSFLPNLANWDGGHYLSIAQFGYYQEYRYAFFPLFPLIVRLLTVITNSFLLSGIIISFISSLLGVYILYKLIRLDFSRKIATQTILTLLLFPTSYYLLAAYTEGLFLFLSVGAIYFTRKNKLILATLFALLSAVTRITGLAVVFSIIYMVFKKEGINHKNWYILFSFSGFLFYCIYQYIYTGDFFYFYTAQINWQRSFAIVGVSIWESIKSLIIFGINQNNFEVLINLIFAVFGFGMVVRSFRFLPRNLSFYSLIAIAFPLATTTLMSFPRFVLMVFPIFILIPILKKRWIKVVYYIISCIFLMFFSALYINGFWIS